LRHTRRSHRCDDLARYSQVAESHKRFHTGVEIVLRAVDLGEDYGCGQAGLVHGNDGIVVEHLRGGCQSPSD
jgi:hypothetical protein